MSAIYSAVKATGGKMQVDAVMNHLSNWKTADSPRGEISIDPKTRDIVQTIYINKVEIVDGKPKNVIIDRIKDVKDPWKTLNPE
jgi:branched-chain amino acid transport system substrate-binding protein